VRLSDGLTCGYVALTIEAMRYNAATGPALDIELPINERHALKSAATRLQIAQFPTGPERGRRTEEVKVDGSYRMMCWCSALS
jgi:hypothetical protein